MSTHNSYIFKFKDLNKIESILNWFKENCKDFNPVEKEEISEELIFKKQPEDFDKHPFTLIIKYGKEFYNVELKSWFNELSEAMTSKEFLDIFFDFCEKLKPYVAFIGIENKPGRILWKDNKKTDIEGPNFMELNQPDDIKFLE